jgi:ubiquinone/menaquinone biosynthesis C-methylase UbiE
MPNEPVRFDNGATYERFMGVWSQTAGETFLAWLAPKPGGRWLDVGCGNGAFTELLATRCAPAAIDGIDPAEGMLAFARKRPVAQLANFQVGDAMALPYGAAAFDVAVMPLVIFFVPEPAKGVTEMVRVTAPGGLVAAYAWDMPGGGFPYENLREALRVAGVPVPREPSPEASRLEVLQELWTKAGLEAVETRVIDVQRTYAGFDDYWTIILGSPSMGATIAKMSPADVAQLQARLRASLPAPDAKGHIICTARAHAVKGRVRR